MKSVVGFVPEAEEGRRDRIAHGMGQALGGRAQGDAATWRRRSRSVVRRSAARHPRPSRRRRQISPGLRDLYGHVDGGVDGARPLRLQVHAPVVLGLGPARQVRP